jgi:hypothetical protein
MHARQAFPPIAMAIVIVICALPLFMAVACCFIDSSMLLFDGKGRLDVARCIIKMVTASVYLIHIK